MVKNCQAETLCIENCDANWYRLRRRRWAKTFRLLETNETAVHQNYHFAFLKRPTGDLKPERRLHPSAENERAKFITVS
jgi:hypothetical protein